MRKQIIALTALITILITGCGSANTQTSGASDNTAPQSAQDMAQSDNEASQDKVSQDDTESAQELPRLTLQLGEGSSAPVYEIILEDNEVALAFARVMQRGSQTIPVYVHDGSQNSDVMHYYDVPDSYDIPAGNPELVTSEKVGDVYFSNGRIMYYYKDAEIEGDYVKVGVVDMETPEQFTADVEANPDNSWGNLSLIVGIKE